MGYRVLGYRMTLQQDLESVIELSRVDRNWRPAQYNCKVWLVSYSLVYTACGHCGESIFDLIGVLGFVVNKRCGVDRFPNRHCSLFKHAADCYFPASTTASNSRCLEHRWWHDCLLHAGRRRRSSSRRYRRRCANISAWRHSDSKRHRFKNLGRFCSWIQRSHDTIFNPCKTATETIDRERARQPFRQHSCKRTC